MFSCQKKSRVIETSVGTFVIQDWWLFRWVTRLEDFGGYWDTEHAAVEALKRKREPLVKRVVYSE